MQTRNPILEDLARVAGGAASAFGGIKQELEALFRDRLERLLADVDAVPRDEFEVVRDMVQKAREENEAQAKRIAKLERQLAAAKPESRAKAKPAAAKTRKKA